MHFLYYLDAYCLDGIKKLFKSQMNLFLCQVRFWNADMGCLEFWTDGKNEGFKKMYGGVLCTF